MIDILGLKNWVPVCADKTPDNKLAIRAEYLLEPKCCTKCGSISFYKHGPKSVTYRDSPIREYTVTIEAVLKRYRCRECGCTFLQPVTGMHSEMRMTSRCVAFIQDRFFRYTFVDLAQQIGCDDKTVRTIANEYVDRLNKAYKPKLPTMIGIDETTIDGKLRFIITDIVDRKPIDLLIDREKPTVSDFLWKHRNDKVEVVAMDMWLGYKSVVYAIYPNATIVIDKFHVLRMANEAVDKIRLKLSKDRVKAIGQDWKRRKSLLRMRYKNLSEHGKYNLDMWLENEPDIAIAHNLKELFYLIYEMPNREDAESLLDEWLDMVPADICKGKSDFKPLVTIFKQWRNEIMNYFDYRVTNGYTEAVNGVAKVMNRQGRGYTFDILRARLVFKKIHRDILKTTDDYAIDFIRDLSDEDIDEFLESHGQCKSCSTYLVFEPEINGEHGINNLCMKCFEKSQFHTEE